MGFIILIIIGAAAGFLATRLMDFPLGVPQTVALGVLGAIIGGYALSLLLAVIGIGAGFLGAILGAMALIWAYKAFTTNRK